MIYPRVFRVTSYMTFTWIPLDSEQQQLQLEDSGLVSKPILPESSGPYSLYNLFRLSIG